MIFEQILTPAVFTDTDIAEANIGRFQTYCDGHNLPTRPYIKTHKLPLLAKVQIAAGAIGITCQKISEAEAMIPEGEITDVSLSCNILGSEKVTAFRDLASRISLSVVADNDTVVDGLVAGFDASGPLRVLSAIPLPDPTIPKPHEILRGDTPNPSNSPSGCVFRPRCCFTADSCASGGHDAVTVSPNHISYCKRVEELNELA